MMSRFNPLALGASALLMLSSPALADVKAGVEAWQRGDFPAAVAAWRPEAIAGNRDAQFNLGQAYKLGRGVPADLAQAEEWYRKAALQGHDKAEDNYGLIMFQNGKRREALPWIEKSAARGEPRAQYILGTALFNGDGIAKDWVRAYALMTRASAAGLAPASTSLAQMDKFIPLDQRQQGLKMAQELEASARRPQIAQLPPAPMAAPPIARPVARDVDVPPAMPSPMPEPAPMPDEPEPEARAVAASDGPWRIQFGAFSQQSRAEALWSQLERRHGALASLQPYLVTDGRITKLQAGGFASEAAASRACGPVKAGGQACIAIRKGR